MPNMADILVSTICTGIMTTSSATVASNKTLAPDGFTPGGVAHFVDRSGGVALGYDRLTYQMRPPTRDSRIFKQSAKLFQPILETIDPAVGIYGPKLAYENQAHLDILIHERATSAERIAFLSMLVSLVSQYIIASDSDPSSTVGSPIVAGTLTNAGLF